LKWQSARYQTPQTCSPFSFLYLEIIWRIVFMSDNWSNVMILPVVGVKCFRPCIYIWNSYFIINMNKQIFNSTDNIFDSYVYYSMTSNYSNKN
jgi:hypothetical protein